MDALGDRMKVYYCTICGKTSPTKAGEGGDRGWDISCYINCIPIPILREHTSTPQP